MRGMSEPTWFQWVTVAAIVVGPVLALSTQRMLDWMREKTRRVNLYRTLMGLRATPLHPDHVQALNSIDAIFDQRGDQKVRDAWGAVLAHLLTEANAPQWGDKLADLRVDLLQAVGKTVGYDHSIDYIKNRLYSPKLYGDMEVEHHLIRQGLARVITNDGIRVVLIEPSHDQARATGTSDVGGGT